MGSYRRTWKEYYTVITCLHASPLCAVTEGASSQLERNVWNPCKWIFEAVSVPETLVSSPLGEELEQRTGQFQSFKTIVSVSACEGT